MRRQEDESRIRMNEFFDQLSLKITAVPCGHGVTGLSRRKINAVRSQYPGLSLPGYYLEFLRRMGASAGALWAGTDAFYPRLLMIKSWTRELLAENNVSHLMPEKAIVIAMHQGYQAYWTEPCNSDNPPVVTYIEGQGDIAERWNSFSDLLRHETPQASAV